ncbi:MAG: hypothetical protein V7K92_22160 [Nostoc sp.]
MSLNIELLESSFLQIKAQETEFMAHFYKTLFADYPEVKPLFANTHMGKQAKQLFKSLVLVVENLRNPDVLSNVLKGLKPPKFVKEVSLEKIANPLPVPILFESRRKKIQRFLSLPILNIQKIWFPLIKNWLTQNFPENQRIYLVIDRTKWQRKNLMMISLGTSRE